MTYLELVQRLRMESGIAGTGPTTTVNQIGELGRLVSWIDAAYEDIQNKRNDWRFLRKNFTLALVSAQNIYPRTSPQLTLSGGDVKNWKRNSLRIYTDTVNFSDELWLPNRDWDLFRDNRLRGASSNQTGRPIEFSSDPSKDIYVWPKPNAATPYFIRGEYYQAPDVFINDSSEPIFDTNQMAIVYNALMRYASYVSEPALFSYAQQQYGRLIGKLEADWAEPISRGGALA